MRTPVQLRKAWEKIIIALAMFDYLTAAQVTRLLYALTSVTHVQEQMKLLVDNNLVIALGGKALNLPLIYTLSAKGRQYAQSLGAPARKRYRLSEEQEKSHNPYFLKHTVAVTDVLIAAKLLAQAVPGIVLTRMSTERELRRTIYVEVPEPRLTRPERICIEPDASVHFLITETWHQKPQTWEDFFFIEVYRNLPPREWRFKQKIQGYVSYLDSGHHEALFQTPVLTVMVVAETGQMAATLKRWAEDALQDIARPEEGEMFFFGSLHVATARPEDMFLSPVWKSAFSSAKTPLLVLK
jgi:hypothetical protein